MLSDWKKILTIRRFHQAGQFAARFFCNFKLLAHHYIARATLMKTIIEMVLIIQNRRSIESMYPSVV